MIHPGKNRIGYHLESSGSILKDSSQTPKRKTNQRYTNTLVRGAQTRKGFKARYTSIPFRSITQSLDPVQHYLAEKLV